MQRILLLLAMLWGSTLFATTPTVDLSDYSLILSGNATVTSHVHLGAIVGGNLTLSGNADFGRDVGQSSTAIVYVGGKVYGNGHQLGLFNESYYFAKGKQNTTLQNPGYAYSKAPFNPNTVFSYFDNQSSTYAAKATSGASYSINGSTMNINSSGGNSILNLNLNTLNFFSGNNLAINFAGMASSKLIINVQGTGSAFSFNAQTLGVANASNILWNFTNMPTLNIGNGASTFNGTILATGSTVNWSANDLNGQLIASNLVENCAHEYHPAPFFVGSVDPIPEPSTYALCGFLMCSALLWWRRHVTLRGTQNCVQTS